MFLNFNVKPNLCILMLKALNKRFPFYVNVSIKQKFKPLWIEFNLVF